MLEWSRCLSPYAQLRQGLQARQGLQVRQGLQAQGLQLRQGLHVRQGLQAGGLQAQGLQARRVFIRIDGKFPVTVSHLNWAGFVLPNVKRASLRRMVT
jgi:hypothetical protein